MIRARSTALVYNATGEASHPKTLGRLLKVNDRNVTRVQKTPPKRVQAWHWSEEKELRDAR
jgi:hypothetical protein